MPDPVMNPMSVEHSESRPGTSSVLETPSTAQVDEMAGIRRESGVRPEEGFPAKENFVVLIVNFLRILASRSVHNFVCQGSQPRLDTPAFEAIAAIHC
jgi:hypothetical protein